MKYLQWYCHICKAMRPDKCISVAKLDFTPEGMPAGTMIQNTRYCNDNPKCKKEAEQMKDPFGTITFKINRIR